MDHDPPDDDELFKSLYAHFGLAYYLAECVYEGLIQVVATHGVGVTTGVIDERTKRWKQETLGPLVAAAKASFSENLHAEMDRVVVRRNDLAHGYWFRVAHMMKTREGVESIIAELRQDQELFQKFSQLSDDIASERMSLSAEQWAKAMEEVNSPPDEVLKRPLPRPGAQMRITRAWFHPAAAYVFEDDMKELWQLCDRGLGWYTGPGPEADWRPAKLSTSLPATVIGRPKDAKPWDYTLEFSTGVVMQVIIDDTTKRPRVNLIRPRK